MERTQDQLKEQHVSSSRLIFVKAWVLYFFGGREGVLKAQVLASVILLVTYLMSNHFVSLGIRFLSGIFALVLIPGCVISSKFMPKQIGSISATLMIGVLLFALVCQIQMWLLLLFGWIIPVIVTSLVLEFLVVIAMLINTPNESYGEDFWIRNLGFSINDQLGKLFLIAIVVRFLLQALVPNSFSPDAALLADYARGVCDGTFQSHVHNDISVLELWNGGQFVIHQGYSYLLALSLLLHPVEGVGTFVILPILGSALIFPIYLITNRFFGEKAAFIVASLVVVNPLMIFHSAVGYGPEIVSLLFLAYSLVLLFRRSDRTTSIFILAGLMVGFIDVVWYTNFYIMCVILPIVVYIYGGGDIYSTLGTAFLTICILISKLFFRHILLFYSLWLIIFGVIVLQHIIRSDNEVTKKVTFYLGIFLVLVFWRLPLQLVAEEAGTVTSTDTPLIEAILASIGIDVILSFFFFLFFHITIGVFAVLVYLVVKGENRKEILSILLIGAIIAIGTLKVFALTTGSLQLEYIYSDSRFFVFLSAMALVAVGAYLSKVNLDGCSFSFWKKSWRESCVNRRPVYVMAVIILFFVPGFVVYPMGTELVNSQDRYGWNGLAEIVGSVGDVDSIFIVDRAREFSWITGRMSAAMELSAFRLPYMNASSELIEISEEYGAMYLIFDGYTVAHWQTLSHLYEDNIILGNTIVLGLSQFDRSLTEFKDVMALRLVGANAPNHYGRYSRVYEIVTANFSKLLSIPLNASEWGAGNNGNLTSVEDGLLMTIGSGMNYTFSWRPGGFDLDLQTTPGFISLSIANISGDISRISVWDSDGEFMGYAEEMSEGNFICFVGNETVGDINIVLEGAAGDSFTLSEIAYWRSTNS